jgi:hypothetical protein
MRPRAAHRVTDDAAAIAAISAHHPWSVVTRADYLAQYAASGGNFGR